MEDRVPLIYMAKCVYVSWKRVGKIFSFSDTVVNWDDDEGSRMLHDAIPPFINSPNARLQKAFPFLLELMFFLILPDAATHSSFTPKSFLHRCSFLQSPLPQTKFQNNGFTSLFAVWQKEFASFVALHLKNLGLSRLKLGFSILTPPPLAFCHHSA